MDTDLRNNKFYKYQNRSIISGTIQYPEIAVIAFSYLKVWKVIHIPQTLYGRKKYVTGKEN